MRNIIGYKLLGVFLFLIISLGSILFLHMENMIKSSEISYIENQLVKEARYSDSLLTNYNKTLLSRDRYFVDPQSYLTIVRELSKFVKDTKLQYIRSYIVVDGKFILTATSATDAEFVAKSYADYGYIDEKNVEILSQVHDSNSSKYIFLDDKIAIGIDKGKSSYIILSKVDKGKLGTLFSYSYRLLGSIVLISILAFLIIAYMIISIHRKIVSIDNSLGDLFEYILEKKDVDEIRYIENISRDQLGVVSKRINENIKSIIDRFEIERDAKKSDDIVISELIEALKPTLSNHFGQEVLSTANNPRLNELRNITNSMLSNTDRLLQDIQKEIDSYMSRDFISKIDEKDYQGESREFVHNINQLSANQSEHLMNILENLMQFSSNNRLIETHIDRFTEDLNYLLISLKKITDDLDSDYKFVFEFDKSIDIIKKENRYINSILDNFGHKYEASISLLDDLKSGVFRDNRDEFIDRLDRVIRDSSIKDATAQEGLIAKIRDLTADNMVDISSDKVRELLRLLLEELLKDIKYSLYLIEDRVEKLSKDSSTRLVSFESIGELSKSMRDILLQELKNAQEIEDIVTSLINKNSDIEHEIMENNRFVGHKEMYRFLSQKGEL